MEGLQYPSYIKMFPLNNEVGNFLNYIYQDWKIPWKNISLSEVQLLKKISLSSCTNNCWFFTFSLIHLSFSLGTVDKMKGFFLSLLVKTSSHMNVLKSSNSEVIGQDKMLIDLHCSSRGCYWLSPRTFQHCLWTISYQVKLLQFQQLVLLLIFWS